MRDRPDEELLAAIARRDGSAMAAFYRRHLPGVLAFLMAETRDPEIAADLAAEVFAAVIQAAPRYRARHESALPWVVGIARNLLGASRRRRRVEDRARRRLGYEPVALDDSDLERVLELAAEASQARPLVEALPAHERHAVVEHVINERGYAELAAELRCSEMVVRKRVSRGLQRIRTELEREG